MWVLAWWFVQDSLERRTQNGDKFARNMMSAFHSMCVIYLCQHVPEWVRPISIGYFIQDIRNYPLGSVYIPHHIISVIVLYASSGGAVLEGFRICELSNLPIYCVYAMKHHPATKDKKWLILIAMVAEFISFLLLRCLAALPILIRIENRVGGMAQLIYYASVWWTIKLGVGVLRHAKKCI